MGPLSGSVCPALSGQPAGVWWVAAEQGWRGGGQQGAQHLQHVRGVHCEEPGGGGVEDEEGDEGGEGGVGDVEVVQGRAQHGGARGWGDGTCSPTWRGGGLDGGSGEEGVVWTPLRSGGGRVA